MSLVVPAVLPSSRIDLEEKLSLFARIPSLTRIQVDVIDGRFASPASWPFSSQDEFHSMVENGEMLPYLDCIEYEIDCMCFGAESVAGEWLSIGASRIIFHAESVTDLPQLIAYGKKHYGDGNDFTSRLISFGLAVNIASDISLIEPCLPDVAFVQFMGIDKIGRQGQPFDERVFEKIRIFHSRHPELPIQVDGGVSLGNAKKIVALGVSNLVIGSALQRASDLDSIIAEFEELQSPYGV